MENTRMCNTAVRSLIRDCYASAHDAQPAADYPTYLSVGAPEHPQAVLGFRGAAAGPIFLERYLDQTIEDVLSRKLGRPVSRNRIIELGDHASKRPSATVALWSEAAAALHGQAEIAVAVLTRPLRQMFERLGFDLMALGPARIEALGPEGARWGRYYDADPVVCAGDIAACRKILEKPRRL
jgi:hypothetical protein